MAMDRTMERTTVVGVFRDRDAAEQAIDELHRLGFTDGEIGFAVRGADRVGGTTTTATEQPRDTGSSALGGAIAGAGVGGIIAAAAALLIPGFGPVVAGGILATILGGAAVGAAAGGILGALISLGVPEEEAHYYEREFNEGRIIVTVKAGNRYSQARDVLRRFGAYDMEQQGGMTTAGPSPTTHTEQDRVELREEHIQARTEPVQTGEVTVGKKVVTERQEMDVPVRREEVTVERHPVEERPPASGPIREGEEIRIPVHEERVEVEKQPVVYEQVEIGRREVQDTERVAADLRREEARIERQGEVNVRGWDEIAPEFRQSWQTRYGTRGGSWEEYAPAYRYGYEMAADPRYRDRDWTTVEPELRRDYRAWAERHSYRYDENAWDRFKDSIRESWDRVRGQRPAA